MRLYSCYKRIIELVDNAFADDILYKYVVHKTYIIEYGSTLYVGLQLKQNGRPYKAMVRTVSKSQKEAFLKLQKVSSLHYHAFL